jgi:hypothetical protein
MGWVKCLIFSLGLLLVAQVALARDIEHYTDKQGTVHITNLEPRGSGNRAKPDRLEASPPPAALPAPSPTHPAPREPVPPPPPPKSRRHMPPNLPRPGLRRQPRGSTAARPATDRSGGEDAAAAAAMGTPLPFSRVSCSPPPPVRAVRRDKIAVYRDHDGLIHISNVPKQEEPSVAPVARFASVEQPALSHADLLPAWPRASWPVAAPVPAAILEARARAPSPILAGKTIHRYLDRQGVLHITNLPPPDRLLLQAKLAAPADKLINPVAHSPPVAPVKADIAVENQVSLPGLAAPAFKEASYTRLGPEVTAYIDDKLRAASRTLVGNTIHRYRDRDGVWHITNNPLSEPPSGPTRLAVQTTQIAWPSISGLPLSQSYAGLAWETGLSRPPPGATGRTVIARRDHRGVLHIFSPAAVQVKGGRDSPMAFLRRVSPSLQFCIMQAAHLYGLPVPLVLALIHQESNFAPQAISPKGAMGLMQLMPDTATLLGVRDPFAPRENILAGCRYFRFLLNYFQGSVPLALAAYNAGSQRVISAGYRVPAIHETQQFVTRVMGLYFLLEKHAASL